MVYGTRWDSAIWHMQGVCCMVQCIWNAMTYVYAYVDVCVHANVYVCVCA